MIRHISDELVKKVRKWLGKDGLEFFEWCLKEHGRIDAVYMKEGIPYPVHFRDGMSVRNYMRYTRLCKKWYDHDFDDNWVRVVQKALNLKEE